MDLMNSLIANDLQTKVKTLVANSTLLIKHEL